MKLNWNNIYWNYSVNDLFDFIDKHKKELTTSQIDLLQNRIIQMRASNNKFVEGLVNSSVFKAGVALTGRKYKKLYGVSSFDFVSDPKLFKEFKNRVFDNCKIILDKLTDMKRGEFLAKARARRKK